MELFPQIFPFQRNFGIVDDAVLLRLYGPQRPHHGRMVIVRGHRGQHHVLGGRERMPGQRMVRMRMVDFRYQRARIAAVRVAGREAGQSRREEAARRRGRIRPRRIVVGGG